MHSGTTTLDTSSDRGNAVKTDNELHEIEDVLKCIYSTDTSQIGQSVTVEARNGKAALITVPAASFVIFE